MPSRATLSERLRYAFDNSMSRGAPAMVAWLAAASAAFLLVCSVLVWVTGLAPAGDGGERPGLLEVAWMGLMRTLDAGTMGGDAGSWPYLLMMLLVTMGGIFIISTLIGVLSSGIESRLEALQKGRSRVLESDHTVILGWSPKVFTLISELVQANESRKRACIVVMGPKDKVEMEDEIRERVPDTRTTRIVCRTGSPVDLADLEIVSIQETRNIILLSPEDENPDSQVIKALLAITNNPKRRSAPYHVVAEIHDPRNVEVARMVGRHEVEVVLAGDLLSRITVQTCRQSGLSVVYQELLDFGGCEIYFREVPELKGRTFGQALMAFEKSSVLGLRPRKGGVRLNPPMDTLIEEGDQVIVIAEDDSTIQFTGLREDRVDNDAIQAPAPVLAVPERTLILGWNWRVPTLVRELDGYVPPGSQVTIVADFEEGKAELARRCARLNHLKVSYAQADTTDRRTLDALHVPECDHIISLCDDGYPVQQADARALITLLHLRDIGEKAGKDLSIVSEMLDMRDRELAEVTRADDFIVGDKLISLMMAQVAENKELNAVFADLFDPEGSEVYIKPAGAYVTLGRPVDFYTVAHAARQRGECAIGYRMAAQAKDAARSYGVVVNPTRSQAVTFGEGDRIVVVAES